MTKSLLPTCLAIVAAALSAGCSLIVQNIGTQTEFSSRRAASYDGDACEEVLYPLSEHGSGDYNHDDRKFPQRVDEGAKAQILLLTCERDQKQGVYGHEIKQWPRVKDIEDEKVYYALDDRRLDIVLMAASAVNIMDDEFERYRRGNDNDKKSRGLVRLYAELIDREKLATRVGKVGVPAEASQAFLALYDDAVRRARGASLSPPEQALYVQVPYDTYKSRKAHFKKFSALYKQLDELSASSKESRSDAKTADELITKLMALRAQFLAECGLPECRSLPLWANATKELALLHVARGNALDAMVESAMNTRQGSYVAGFTQAIRAAQEAEGRKMSEARRKYKKAKESGVDDETALSIAGGTTGYDFSEGMLLNPKMSLPNYAEALDVKGGSRLHEEEVPVASVQPAGPKARVVFEKETYQSEEAYNCQQTNRVTRIRSDGTLDYEEICSYRPSSRTVEKHAPINVPAAEAKLIRRGDSVRFVARGDEARVTEVKRDGKVIQVRGDALGAKK